MKAPFQSSTLMDGKFAIGQLVSRKEDPIPLRGEGRYADDLMPNPSGCDTEGLARRECVRLQDGERRRFATPMPLWG